MNPPASPGLGASWGILSFAAARQSRLRGTEKFVTAAPRNGPSPDTAAKEGSETHDYPAPKNGPWPSASPKKSSKPWNHPRKPQPGLAAPGIRMGNGTYYRAANLLQYRLPVIYNYLHRSGSKHGNAVGKISRTMCPRYASRA